MSCQLLSLDAGIQSYIGYRMIQVQCSLRFTLKMFQCLFETFELGFDSQWYIMAEYHQRAWLKNHVEKNKQ